MKRRVCGSLLALVVAAVLTACSSISAGYVTKKEYSPAYFVPVTYCAMFNAKGICVVWATRQDYHPERFTLRLIESNDLLDRDAKTGWVTVSEGTYDSYEVGDWYPRESR